MYKIVTSRNECGIANISIAFFCLEIIEGQITINKMVEEKIINIIYIIRIDSGGKNGTRKKQKFMGCNGIRCHKC